MTSPAPVPASLSTLQTARANLRAGRFQMEAEVHVTPLGLLAIGGLVASILLSVPPIIRAAGEVSRSGGKPIKQRAA